MAGPLVGREVYIELIAVGGLIKATAIDAATGTEASIFGPKTTPRDALERAAAAKLDYVLKKQKGR